MCFTQRVRPIHALRTLQCHQYTVSLSPSGLVRDLMNADEL